MVLLPPLLALGVGSGSGPGKGRVIRAGEWETYHAYPGRAGFFTLLPAYTLTPAEQRE